MTQCRACGHIFLVSEQPSICDTCADLHARALERMEEEDGALELYVLVARIMFGEPPPSNRLKRLTPHPLAFVPAAREG